VSRALAVATLAVAVAAAPSLADPQAARLRRSIDRIVDRPALARGFWGIEVRSLRTGRVLYARNAEKAFRPASALKLVTTAAALDALGPDARVRTSVETAGRIDAFGRILGDVLLVGRGDPRLSGDETDRPLAALEAMADALVASGVRRIEGHLIGHEGALADERRGSDWTWEDLVWGYGAEVSALSFRDNVVALRLLPGGRPGEPARLEIEPLTSGVGVESMVLTADAGVEEDLTLTREPGSNHVRLSGRLPLGRSWEGRVAVVDPARHATSAFAEVLAARGIRVTGGLLTSSAPLPEGLRVLAAHDGPSLAEAINFVNKDSLNLHAELLLRRLGLQAKGEGSVAKGREAVLDFLARAGVASEGWALTDGSGLARTDLVTPGGLVALLLAMDRHPQAAVFRDSLAVAGVDGTLETRLRGTPSEGRVRAKTGTLRQVNALAGYATTTGGERLAFAILVNNAERGPDAVGAIDEIATVLAAAR